MPGNKQALAEALVAIPHVTGEASKLKDKHTKATLIGKVWAAQCTECESERREAEYDDNESDGSMPPLQSRTRAAATA